MDETQTQAPARRPSGRDAKRASRAARAASSVPYITRKIPYYEVLGEEGLALLERNADTILEEVGIDFRDDPEALQLWREAGADVKGERVHFARGLCRSIIQRSAPREFTQHARNPAASSSAARTPSSRRPMALRSCAVSTKDGVMRASRIFAISSNSPTWRDPCTIRGAPSASPWICR